MRARCARAHGPRVHAPQGAYPKLLLCLVPIMLATWVGCTRLTDFKHHFSDVNAGAFIGISSGLVAYCLNFCSLLGADAAGQPKTRSNTRAYEACANPPDSAEQPMWREAGSSGGF